MFLIPQRHGATQTEFLPRPRQTEWRSDIRDAIYKRSSTHGPGNMAQQDGDVFSQHCLPCLPLSVLLTKLPNSESTRTTFVLESCQF